MVPGPVDGATNEDLDFRNFYFRNFAHITYFLYQKLLKPQKANVSLFYLTTITFFFSTVSVLAQTQEALYNSFLFSEKEQDDINHYFFEKEFQIKKINNDK